MEDNNSHRQETQEKNGFTKIQNDFLDALIRTRIPGEARQVFDYIIRQTLGYRKTSNAIALDNFCEQTGLSKNRVFFCLKRLMRMNLIAVVGKKPIKTKTGVRMTNIYQINVDSESWALYPKKGINTLYPNMDINRHDFIPKYGYKGKTLYPNLGTTKENKHIKENLSKESEKQREILKPFLTATANLWRGVSRNNKYAKLPDMDDWAATLSQIGAPPADIEQAALWCQSDVFWIPKVLNAADLAKHFVRITAWMKNGSSDYSDFIDTPTVKPKWQRQKYSQESIDKLSAFIREAEARLNHE